LNEVNDTHELMQSMPFIIRLAIQHFRLEQIHEAQKDAKKDATFVDYLKTNKNFVVGSALTLTTITLLNVLKK